MADIAGSISTTAVLQFDSTGTVGVFDSAFESFVTTLANGFLAGTAFKANATGTATELDDRIIYNTTTGALIYDTNGSLGGGAVQFATLTSAVKPALTSADFFVF